MVKYKYPKSYHFKVYHIMALCAFLCTVPWYYHQYLFLENAHFHRLYPRTLYSLLPQASATNVLFVLNSNYFNSSYKPNHMMFALLGTLLYHLLSSRITHAVYVRISFLMPFRMAHACNPNSWEVEAERSRVQSHPQLYREFKNNRAYRRPCKIK